MNKKELEQTHNMLNTNLSFFCKHVLKIKDKETGKIIPFVFNKAQQYLHENIEKQKRTIGKVRALVLKGRQQGSSTYCGARGYFTTTRSKGKSAFVMAHDSNTTEYLYNMVERYHNYAPDCVKPKVSINNRRRISFEGIESNYYVGTAGSKNYGRGGTNHWFHGSEVPLWENSDEIETGILQSIPDAKNTEIILEGTANGMGNMFYDRCIQAIEDEKAERDGRTRQSDYILIFIPWFWQNEYRREIEKDFELTEKEIELKGIYGLDNEQINWRRNKIAELGNEWKFKQEYPNNPMEAFISSGEGLIDSEKIEKARKCEQKEDKSIPLVMGVDPALEGDRTVVAFRRGKHFIRYFKYDYMEPMMLAGICAKMIDKFKPKKCFIDVGLGYGTIDRLKELGYDKTVTGIHFGSKALEDKIYANKRAEIYWSVREFIYQDNCNIPDDDDVSADLKIIPFPKENSTNRMRFASKVDIRKEYRKSPDIFDALALTFSYPVRIDEYMNRNRNKIKVMGTGLNTSKRRKVS